MDPEKLSASACRHLLRCTDGCHLKKVEEELRTRAFNASLSGEMKGQDYWNNGFKYTNSAGTLLQTNLSRVIAVLLSFTISNALVERVFIQLKLIKNDHRIPQKHECLLALMQTKYFLKTRDHTRLPHYNLQKR
eukprot:gene16419-7826_t